MAIDAGKAEPGTEYEDILGTGILVEQGGGVVTGGVEGGKGRRHAGRPVLMSRAMRDFAGLDQVPSCFLSLVSLALLGSPHSRDLQLEPHRPLDLSALAAGIERGFVTGNSVSVRSTDDLQRSSQRLCR